jgi:pimeloyl-ACP methyl ester carboxylesterase
MHRFELSDGAALAFTDTGKGRVILLLHGVCMSRIFFERNVEVLAERYRVIAVDFRSHGDSPIVEGGHTVAQYARDIHALLDHLQVDDVTAVGWSMGNFILWDYLRQFGQERFASIVVVSQGPSDLIQDDWPVGFADVSQLHGFVADIQDDFRTFLVGYVPTMFKDELQPEQLARFVESGATVGANSGALILIDQTLQDYRTRIPTFSTPHLLVWGIDEKTIKLASKDWLVKHLPEVESVVFDNSGHCPMWEEPERFNQLVDDWMSRH